MTDQNDNEFVRRAEDFYATRLAIYWSHCTVMNSVAIEPESGDYFLGQVHSVKQLELRDERTLGNWRTPSAWGIGRQFTLECQTDDRSCG